MIPAGYTIHFFVIICRNGLNQNGLNLFFEKHKEKISAGNNRFFPK